MGDLQVDSAETELLLRQIRAGDPAAFEKLFARHRAYLRRIAEVRLGADVRPRVDPSDVVQEAYLEAFRRLQTYLEQTPVPFRLWLRQIVHDQAIKARRSHLGTARRALGREVPLPERSSLVLVRQLLAGGSTPSQHLGRRELAQRLRQAVTQLSAIDREVVIMRDFEGLSNQEVGYLLGIEPAAVSQRHGRALLRLHKLLFEGGLTESQL
jgi:RNA polymerase sigma-70 factor, ECF subfamily